MLHMRVPPNAFGECRAGWSPSLPSLACTEQWTVAGETTHDQAVQWPRSYEDSPDFAGSNRPVSQAVNGIHDEVLADFDSMLLADKFAVIHLLAPLVPDQRLLT